MGGHHACLRISSRGIIAKPLDEHGHERNFYETLLPSGLREFVPEFHGTIFWAKLMCLLVEGVQSVELANESETVCSFKRFYIIIIPCNEAL